MDSIKVTIVSHDWSGDIIGEMDRKFFKDMVVQAMFYPGSSITVDNHTLSGTTLLTKRVSQPALKRYYGDVKKAVFYLWQKAKTAGHIVFTSKFEHVEYVVQKPQ